MPCPNDRKVGRAASGLLIAVVYDEKLVFPTGKESGRFDMTNSR